MPLTDLDSAATYKILVLGDTTVGKSSLLRCLTGQEFQGKIRRTIGLDFVRRSFEVDGALITLNVWDTAGQQRFQSITRKHYKGVQGIVLVYDVTDRKSFTHLSFWVDSVNKGISNSKNQYDAVPMMLIGNKTDLEEERTITEEEGKEFAVKSMVFDFIETSAKMNQNVFMVFKRLAQFVTESFDPKVMKSYHPYMLRPPEIMEKKRKESLSVKKKRLFKKQNKSNSKKDKNREEFSYIGSNPTVKYKNDGYSKVEIIYSSNKKPEISEDLLNGNGGKIRGLRLTKTELKDKHRRRKRRTVGYLWRKLFRRKRKKESSNNESKRQTNHRCVIS